MSPQRTTTGWNVAIIVTVLMAAFGLSVQVGRYQERVDRLLKDQESQRGIDAYQDERLGRLDVRTSDIKKDVDALKEGRYDRDAGPFGRRKSVQ